MLLRALVFVCFALEVSGSQVAHLVCEGPIHLTRSPLRLRPEKLKPQPSRASRVGLPCSWISQTTEINAENQSRLSPHLANIYMQTLRIAYCGGCRR